MNPYLIKGPALISFSGGRTSGFMLYEIIKAHGGTLPTDVIPCFANTGKEREETLRFVHECSRWGAAIRWLEWRDGQPPTFEEVGYNSASRNGEPFAALIRRKKYLPNAVTRFCTSELKIRTMRDFARSLGWRSWTNIIGLRHDEPMRVFKALARNDAGKDPWRCAMPLSKAKVIKADVLAFWAGQDFDLRLRHYEGNCDLCFLKGRNKLATIMREQPGIADWWIAQEASANGRFVTEHPYSTIATGVADQGFLFDDDFDAECGLTCEPMT